MGRLRVIVAEDDLLVREGLLSLLSGCEGVEVAAAVSSLVELLGCAEKLAPDVVVTDIRMGPDQSVDGIEAARRLRASHPRVGVVVLSAYVDPAYAVALLDEGSHRRGYAIKDRVDDVGYLLNAIRTVASGGSFIDDVVVEALVRSRSRSDDHRIAALSPRERDVLAELASGRNNSAIAGRLCVSEHAIEKHSSAIFAKLGLSEDPGINRRVKAVAMYLADRDDRQLSSTGVRD